MIKKLPSLILQQIIIMLLLVNPILAATPGGPEVEERTLERIDAFLNTSAPSDIPFIDYLESFSTESSQPLKQFDLSSFEGKKIYVGYGVYDRDQNFCKYVEKPGAPDIEHYFEKITPFNKHTYAKSLSTMSYESCQALAADFGGKPVSITSSAENAFVYSQFSNSEKWIGFARNSCTEDYINVENKKQDFYNWSTLTEQADDCNDIKLNAIQGVTGTWHKKDKNDIFHCIIEVDSEDIKRPIKICAPWWKIERNYEKPAERSFFGVDVYKINQADIPDQITTCTKYDPNIVQDLEAQPNRKVTCTSYYDAMIAPECAKNPEQAICHVDECNGYIKNACRKTDTITPYKDYTKGETIIDGSRKIIKAKSNIKTHVYDCPASNPSIENCQEKSTIVVYPKECPGTQCSEYNECVLNSASLTEKSECANTYPCEKIYPNGNSEVKINETDGTVDYLISYCEDGTELHFEPNLQKKTSKKCLEYEVYEIEEEVSQRCELERPYTDHIVDTSITELDIYMNNPMCIRMNNLVEARPTREVKFDYTNNGFAQTILKKSYLDGEESVDINEGGDEDSRSPAMDAEDIFSDPNIEEATQTINPPVLSACTNYTESWYMRTGSILHDSTSTSSGDYLSTGIYMDFSDTRPYSKYVNVRDELSCTQIKTQINGTSHSYSPITKICQVFIPKMNADIFSAIKGDGSIQTFTDEDNGEVYEEYANYTYISKDSISKDACKEAAYCLDGNYNETAFNSAALSQCQIYAGDDHSFPEDDNDNLETLDELPSSTERDENCVPYPKSGGYLSQLDGLQDIYSVQEVVTGDFGHFSNYNAHPYNNNVVRVNEKEVYPIMPIPVINDPLVYDGTFTQVSITTKEPNIAAGAMGGAAAGAAAYYGQLLIAAGPIGIVVLVVFVVVAILFGKKQKFNEQSYKWTIYKLVPQERYIENVYGYDHRTLVKNLDGSIYSDSEGRYKLIYAELEGFTGTLKPSTFKKILKNMSLQKEAMLTCMGWMKAEVENIMLPVERSRTVSYPKCKSWSWSCDKRKSKTFTKKKDPFYKRTTNSYIGATNGVSVVVPYLGEYEIIAYDKYENILGQITIKEDDFRESTADTAKFAQVLFGLSMDLADQIDEGNEEFACRWDLMTEWGGGVSGIYFENNDTGQNQNCQKSRDGYVQDKSAVKLSVRATNVDRPHFIDLEKPLPFANRVFLVTLNEKEIREYRCYDDFGECESDEFN